MRYELMLPDQIRRAIDERWPVALPLGVLEYHGEHMAVGMDTLAVIGILDILEKEMDLVVSPPFYYGAASYAVEPPERSGALHVDAEALLPFAKALFQGLLRIGFRNIHVVIHHQTENFAAGMPTDLAFKLAARQAIFAFLEKEWGEGWWGSEKMADYYARQSGGDDPFNWIKAHPLMTPERMDGYPFDHAGQGETSLLMALFPEGVDLSKATDDKWYARSAGDASVELGIRGRERILAGLRSALGRKRRDVLKKVDSDPKRQKAAWSAGIAFGTRHILDAFAEAGLPPRAIHAVGGGLRNLLWARATSDVSGSRQELHKVTLGASYGDAFLAALAVDDVPKEAIRSWNPVVSRIEPDAANLEIYARRYAVYRELYPRTRDLMTRLKD